MDGAHSGCIQGLAGNLRGSLNLADHFFAWTNGSSANDDPQLMVLGVAQDAGYPQIDCFEPMHSALGIGVCNPAHRRWRW